MSRVAFDVWSDYLCPWCNVAATRLHQLEDEFGADVELRWRSFLLRPEPEPGRDLANSPLFWAREREIIARR